MTDQSEQGAGPRREHDHERSTGAPARVARSVTRPTRRTAAVGAFALLAVLAGCSALPVGGGVDADYPPGASQDGFEDPGLVADGSREILANRSFTLAVVEEFDGNTTSRAALQYSPTAAHLLIREDDRSAWVEYVEVTDEETRLSWRFSDGTRNVYTYSAVESTDERLAAGTETAALTGALVDRYRAEVAFALQVGDYRAVETVERDGKTLIRYEASSGNRTLIERRYAGSEFESVDFERSVLVSERGVVHRVEIEIRATTVEDGPLTQSRIIEVSRVGETTVRTPAWTNRTPSVRGSLARDGRVLVLDHAGGESFVGTLELSGIGADVGEGFDEVTVDIDDRFAAGDTLYLYVVESDDGVDLRVARAPPEELGNAVDLRRVDSLRVSGQGITRFSVTLSLESN